MTDSPGDAAAKAAAEAAAAKEADAKAKADAKAADDAAKAEAKASASVVKDAAGNPILDFINEPEAVAQAKALGKGASVVAIGVAYHVEKGS
jgi:membrane protein involved in colicin uptake